MGSLSRRGANFQRYETLKDFVRILAVFNSTSVEDKSVAELARAARMDSSKVSRMLRTMEEEGFFERNPETGKYRLGISFFELGLVAAISLPMRKIMRPHIEQMAKENHLTASWGILNCAKLIVADRVQNLNIDLLAYRLGLNLPLHCTSLGKILLAYETDERVEQILSAVPLERFTSKTLVDLQEIREDLKRCKERGFSVDDGETHEDLQCIGAGVWDRTGKVVAAINLTGDRQPPDPNRVLKLAGYLKEKALFISRQLGYEGDRHQ